MQTILLARRPIAPAPPLTTAPVARRSHLPVQVEVDLAVVENHRQLRAARVEVEAAGAAVVDEPRHVLLACVAVPLGVARWRRQELERALGVERVGDGRRGKSALHVEVKVAEGALVSGPDSDLLAAVAFEGELGGVEPETVVWVADRMRYFTVPHCLLLLCVLHIQTPLAAIYSGKEIDRVIFF